MEPFYDSKKLSNATDQDQSPIPILINNFGGRDKLYSTCIGEDLLNQAKVSYG